MKKNRTRAGKPSKGEIERPCRMCGQPTRFLWTEEFKNDNQVRAWVNADGSRHRCREHLPRIVLDVPYKEKEEVKAVGGARWDKAAKVWWAPVSEGMAKFEPWNPTIVDPVNGLEPTGALQRFDITIAKGR